MPSAGIRTTCRSRCFVEAPLELEPLLAELDRIKDDVYRIKGFVPVSDGMVYVDVAAGRVSHREVAVPAERGRPGGAGRTRQAGVHLRPGGKRAGRGRHRQR